MAKMELMAKFREVRNTKTQLPEFCSRLTMSVNFATHSN